MNDFFEFIDLVSGNLAGEYDTAEEALEALRLVAKRHGRTAIENFSLMRIDGDDQSLVAMQEELVSLVESFGRRRDSARIFSRAS